MEQCFPGNLVALPNFTYLQFASRVRCAAHAFVHKLALRPGAKVGVLALNSREYLELYFSLSFAGLVIVPLNFRLGEQELQDLVSKSSCEALVVDDKHVGSAVGWFPNLKLVVMGRPQTLSAAAVRAGVVVHELEALLVESPALVVARENLDAPDLYGIFYTSGTSGQGSKGVMLSHEGLLINASCLAQAVKINQRTVYLHCAPMFHVADSTSTFAVSMLGGTHAFVASFHPEPVLIAMEQHGVTHTLLVPSMFPPLFAHGRFASCNLQSLRYVAYGSSPMPNAVITQALRALPEVKFVQGYGMTECSPVMTFLLPEHHFAASARMNSVGQCVPHGLLRVCDQATGSELPRGAVGEIYYRGPNVMLGYYNDPKATNACLTSDGWLKTGDAGRMDVHGFVFLADRINQAIATRLGVVHPAQVESAIRDVPGVLDCAVLGVKPPTGEFELVAAVVVVPKPTADEGGVSLTAEAIQRHLRPVFEFDEFKIPTQIVFTHTRLPLNAVGKVSKTQLRQYLS